MSEFSKKLFIVTGIWFLLLCLISVSACGEDYSGENELLPYAITYDLNGGDALCGNAIRRYGVLETDTVLPSATRNGYDFMGWQTESGQVVKVLAAYTTGDVSLIAVWERSAFKITFSIKDELLWSDGGSGDKVVYERIGTGIIFPQTVDTEYFTFKGWAYTDKNGFEREIEEQTVLTLENLNVSEFDITVYVKTESSYSWFY